MWSHLYIFPFTDLGFGVKYKNSLPRPGSGRFSSLKKKSFTLSVIHFELIYIEGVRFTSRFILLSMDVQLLQRHLLKRLTFPPWNCFFTLVKIWVGIFVIPFLGSLCSSELYACRSTVTSVLVT